MTTAVGLWIDHRKAMLVLVTDTGEETKLVVSRAEKQLRRSGSSPLEGPHEAQRVPADDSRQRRFTGHLNIYYDAVIACIRSAGAILIFGPGEAKHELQRRLESRKLGGRIVGVETVDKMTERQIAARVRQRFRTGSSDRHAAEPRRSPSQPRRPPPARRAGFSRRGR